MRLSDFFYFSTITLTVSAVGSGLHLKNRFGSGYTIKVVTDQCDDVLAYCTKELSWLNVGFTRRQF